LLRHIASSSVGQVDDVGALALVAGQDGGERIDPGLEHGVLALEVEELVGDGLAEPVDKRIKRYPGRD
jgi:hypothetical protein